MNLFIPNHSIMNQSLDIFISLYNFQNVKNLNYWLIDITGFEYINSMGGDLKTLQLDLDDNFFLYKHGKNLKDEITITEYYAIHSFYPRKNEYFIYKCVYRTPRFLQKNSNHINLDNL